MSSLPKDSLDSMRSNASLSDDSDRFVTSHRNSDSMDSTTSLVESDNAGSGPASEIEVSYWTIPNIGQIILLCICRLSEPLAYQSITPYIYFMIRDFGYDDPAQISRYVTVVMTSFALGQSLTAVWWGRLSDSRGRKPTLMLGLLGTACSILVFGTSKRIAVAVIGRMLCGALNGNVGVMRTMVAELVGDKKQWQSRAFAILPIVNNIGTVVGPMVGGLLADPAHAYPKVFGNNKFLLKFPYILPNLFPIPVLVFALITCFLFVEETSSGSNVLLPKDRDPGLRLGRKLKQAYRRLRGDRAERLDGFEYHRPALADAEMSMDELSNAANTSTNSSSTTATNQKSKVRHVPLRRILTKPVVITLTVYVIMMFHSPTVMQLYPLFLATPKIPEPEDRKLPFIFFNGGLAFVSSQIGLVTSVSSILGIVLQLTAYPKLATKIGNAKVHRYALLGFPIIYSSVPYLSLVPEKFEMISAIFMSLLIVLGRTFIIPPMTILITNASPSRKVLGTVHGLTHSIVSAAKTVGPFLIGFLYSLGVKIGMVGLAWWCLAAVAVVQMIVATQLKEWGEDVIVEDIDLESDEEDN